MTASKWDRIPRPSLPIEKNVPSAASLPAFDLGRVSEDFIQLFIYNNINTLVGNDPTFDFYSVTENKEINFDPAYDIESAGFRLGTYNMVYNFLRPLLTQNPNLDLFIYSISPDRREIRVRTTADNDLFFSNAVAYIDLIQARDYFIEYYLDFGNNNLITALSLAVEKDVFGTSTVSKISSIISRKAVSMYVSPSSFVPPIPEIKVSSSIV